MPSVNSQYSGQRTEELKSCNLRMKLLRSPTLNWLKTESHAQAAGDFDKTQRHHEQTPTMVSIQDQNLHKHTKKGGNKNY